MVKMEVITFASVCFVSLFYIYFIGDKNKFKKKIDKEIKEVVANLNFKKIDKEIEKNKLILSHGDDTEIKK